MRKPVPFYTDFEFCIEIIKSDCDFLCRNDKISYFFFRFCIFYRELRKSSTFISQFEFFYANN